MSLDKALADIMKNVPECIAAGWVDMNTGMLLGIKTVDSHPQEVLDVVAAATTDLFQGANVTSIEQMFKRARGVTSDDHYFREVIVMSQNLIHVFARGKRLVDQVLVVVTRVSANLDMVITKSRAALGAVEAVG